MIAKLDIIIYLDSDKKEAKFCGISKVGTNERVIEGTITEKEIKKQKLTTKPLEQWMAHLKEFGNKFGN